MSKRLVPLRRLEGAPAEMSDEAMVAACALGEQAALGALFDRHYQAVRGFLARMSGAGDGDLDDLVQATFETVAHAARRFDGRSAVRTWLLGVAGNVVRHHVRGEIRRRRLAEAAAASTLPGVTDVTAELLQRERASRLHDAILALPVKLREAFVLVYLEGLPGGEVARLLAIREGALWKRLHQARVRLRESLEGVMP